MARITVIVPVYKVEPYIRKCVDSILSQTYPDFDLVLVDDGSPDTCPAICDSYAEKDARITVIHKTNGGLSDARNAGINWSMAHSNSEWLAFVDSDDYIHPDYLRTLYDTAIKESADLVICDFSRVNEQEEAIEDNHRFFDLSTEDKTVLFNCLSSCWRIDPAWNKLYHKRIFENLRFEVKKIHEDEFAIHHVLWNCRKAVIIQQQLYYYRCRSNSIMATESASSMLDEFEALLLQHEFSSSHSLPYRKQQIYNDCFASVVDHKPDYSKQESKRFSELKRRYAKEYFKREMNRNLSGTLRFFCNRPYRMTHKVIKWLEKRDSSFVD